MNQDLYFSYTTNNNKLLYFTHCMHIWIIPANYRFDYHDLKLFQLIVHNFYCHHIYIFMKVLVVWDLLTLTSWPSFLGYWWYSGTGCSSSWTKKGFAYSYFYRTRLNWKSGIGYPSLRENKRPSVFKQKLLQFIWKNLLISTHWPRVSRRGCIWIACYLDI